jgi:hypothetical protein
MLSLQIKRQRDPNVDPKQLLRAHVEQLPLEKQVAFVEAAFQLIAARTATNEANSRSVGLPN